MHLAKVHIKYKTLRLFLEPTYELSDKEYDTYVN